MKVAAFPLAIWPNNIKSAYAESSVLHHLTSAMSANVDHQPMLPQEYLDWEDQQPHKHEYLNGEVYAMTGRHVVPQCDRRQLDHRFANLLARQRMPGFYGQCESWND